jgi:hypothetical protein
MGLLYYSTGGTAKIPLPLNLIRLPFKPEHPERSELAKIT